MATISKLLERRSFLLLLGCASYVGLNPQQVRGETNSTWGTIGLGLANGALGWVGGAAIESLLARDDIDLEDLLEEFARQIIAAVRQEIAADALREARADMKTAEDFYRDYMASRDQSRLEQASIEIGKSKNRIASLDLIGHHSFILAQGMELAVLQEMWKARPEMEGRIKDRAVDAANHLAQMHVLWRQWHEQRYDALWLHDRGYVDRDGHVIRTSNKSFRRTRRYMREHIQSDWESEVWPKHVRESEQIENVWRRI